jgi:hypothetical protein
MKVSICTSTDQIMAGWRLVDICPSKSWTSLSSKCCPPSVGDISLLSVCLFKKSIATGRIEFQRSFRVKAVNQASGLELLLCCFPFLLRHGTFYPYLLSIFHTLAAIAFWSPSSEVILDSELCLLSISTTVSEPWHCSSQSSRPVERKLSFHTRFSLWYLFTRETLSFTERRQFFFPNTVKRAAEQTLSRAGRKLCLLFLNWQRWLTEKKD